jgi:outer membrane receptor protein involved in Fe transport
MQLNVAIFHTTYDDLQTNTLVATTNQVAFVVGNAAEAESEGVEIDLKWRVTEAFKVSAMVGYLDAEYEDYPAAPCWRDQTLAEGCETELDGNRTQDLSGATLLYSPDLSVHVELEYIWQLTDGLDLVGKVGYTYSGPTITSGKLPW